MWKYESTTKLSAAIWGLRNVRIRVKIKQGKIMSKNTYKAVKMIDEIEKILNSYLDNIHYYHDYELSVRKKQRRNEDSIRAY